MRTAGEKIQKMQQAGFTVYVDRTSHEVLARVLLDGRLFAFDYATCHKDDKFDLNIGKEIAVGRVYKQIEDDVQQRSVWRRVSDELRWSRHIKPRIESGVVSDVQFVDTETANKMLAAFGNGSTLGIPLSKFRVEMQVGGSFGEPLLWRVPWRTGKQHDDRDYWPISAKTHHGAISQFKQMCVDRTVPWYDCDAEPTWCRELGARITKVRTVRDDGQAFIWRRERSGEWKFDRIEQA